jgi:hypothetical protein
VVHAAPLAGTQFRDQRSNDAGKTSSD